MDMVSVIDVLLIHNIGMDSLLWILTPKDNKVLKRCTLSMKSIFYFNFLDMSTNLKMSVYAFSKSLLYPLRYDPEFSPNKSSCR